MKCFLTGATGFIGSHFLNLANERDLELIALRRSVDSYTRIPLNFEPNWLDKTMSQVDVEDFRGIDVLVHLAAHSANVPYDSLENCILYNVIEPLALFKKAIKAGVKKFVVAGSCFEYGNAGEEYEFIPKNAPLEPNQSYPTSKAMASIAFRQLAMEHNINLSVHRIFQVFGEGEMEKRLWPSLKKAALEGEDFKMTNGEQIRDFVHVSYVAKHLLNACLENSKNNDLFRIEHVGSGNPQSILDFSSFWWEKWGAKGNLLIGKLPYRIGEVFRFVPEV